MINSLNDVFRFHKSLGVPLDDRLTNLILDKFNFDKERLFKEVQKAKDSLNHIGSLKVDKKDGVAHVSSNQVTVVFEFPTCLPRDVDAAHQLYESIMDECGLLDTEVTQLRGTLNHDEAEFSNVYIRLGGVSKPNVTVEDMNYRVSELLNEVNGIQFTQIEDDYGNLHYEILFNEI